MIYLIINFQIIKKLILNYFTIYLTLIYNFSFVIIIQKKEQEKYMIKFSVKNPPRNI